MPVNTRPIIIFGMHRSGTSALTRVLNFLGYALPQSVTGPSDGNELGHWESARISKLNDEILKRVGINWFSWGNFSVDLLQAQEKKEFIEDMAAALRLDFPKPAPFVIKDPRVCRVGELLLKALKLNEQEPHIFFPLRHPMDVAQSLLKRDGMDVGNGLLLWLRYVLDAELITRKKIRIFLNYEDIVNDPIAEMKRIMEVSEVEFPLKISEVGHEIKRFISPDYKHFSTAPDTLQVDPITRNWVARAYEALRILVHSPDSDHALKEIDAVRSEFNNSTPLMQNILNTMHQKNVEVTHELSEDVQALNSALQEKDDNLATLTTELAEKRAALDALTLELTEGEKRTGALNSNLDKKSALVALKQQEADGLKSQLKGLAQDYDELLLKNTKLTSELGAGETELSNLQRSLEYLDGNLKTKDSHLLELEKKIEMLQSQTDTKSSEVKAKKAEIHQLSKELATKDEALREFEVRTEQLGGELSQIESTLQLRGKDIELRNLEISNLEKQIKELSANFNRQASSSKKAIHEITIDRDDHKIKVETLRSHLTDARKIENLYEESLNQIDDYKARELAQLESRTNLTNLIAQKSSFVNSLSETNAQYANDIKKLSAEISRLQMEVKAEKTTVLKPLVRQSRRFVGSALRKVLPTKFVNQLALKVPTQEQKQMMQLQLQQENIPKKLISATDIIDNTEIFQKSDIFIFAIIGWHFRIQRPQHIARELSHKGHRVFYFEMDPPEDTTEIEELSPNLFRIKLKLDGTPQIPAYTGVPTAEQQKAWLSGFYKFCEGVNATAHKEAIVQHPFWWNLVRLLPPDFNTLNDCMDDIAGFDNTNQELIDLEYKFMEECDRLAVSSQTLFNKYAAYNPLDIIRNATEMEPFINVDHEQLTAQYTIDPLKNRNVPRIKVGYVGAIAGWFDVDLLRSAARARPDIEFHLCGSVSCEGPEILELEPNIYMYGEIPYVQVPAFLSQMDVLTIPFRILPIIRSCDPVKFYEYSALGKPTVTTSLPELSRVKDLAFFADDMEEFCQQIDAAVIASADDIFISKLKTFAAENTWTHRAQQFEQILNDYPLVSIVILSYGDPELTKATLHSLIARGGVYPNMEILIVDNGSSSGSLQVLNDYANRFANVQVFENGENLGFAAGNNVGLDMATGKYVLMLNNDTYVSPGTIYAMVRHLQNNPETGVVGPLTNNIGNEARLELDYDSMDEMIDVSWGMKAGYRGKSISTAVVAYFSVMLRRTDLEIFGNLCTEYGRGMFEDDDHCQLIRSKGYDCRVLEDAFVHHHLSASFSKINSKERQKLFNSNKDIFEKKWGPWVPHQYRTERLKSDLSFDNSDLVISLLDKMG
ncbi:MAG: glycosyltransferase [Hellea sp.]|nr:glycosyltransferase [Hellea sp.]